jgi:hypothetical protein
MYFYVVIVHLCTVSQHLHTLCMFDYIHMYDTYVCNRTRYLRKGTAKCVEMFFFLQMECVHSTKAGWPVIFRKNSQKCSPVHFLPIVINDFFFSDKSSRYIYLDVSD